MRLKLHVIASQFSNWRGNPLKVSNHPRPTRHSGDHRSPLHQPSSHPCHCEGACARGNPHQMSNSHVGEGLDPPAKGIPFPVILSERSESKDLRTNFTAQRIPVRRFFDSPSTTLGVAQNDINEGFSSRSRPIHVIASQRARWRGNPLKVSNRHAAKENLLSQGFCDMLS